MKSIPASHKEKKSISQTQTMVTFRVINAKVLIKDYNALSGRTSKTTQRRTTVRAVAWTVI